LKCNHWAAWDRHSGGKPGYSWLSFRHAKGARSPARRRSHVMSCMVVSVVAALLSGCSNPPPAPAVYKMGDRVEAGPFTYNVFEAEWKAQIGAGERATLPAHRFLLVHFTVTNGGGAPISIPQFTLTDDGGHTYNETFVGADIPSLLGPVRSVKPTETLDGRVLFDVEPKSYKLKLDDVSGAGKSAMVEMPLEFAAPGGISAGSEVPVPAK